MVADLDLDLAEISRDTRQDYGEARFQARGPIGGRLFVVVFTRRGDKLRLISLRRSNKREQVLWENR